VDSIVIVRQQISVSFSNPQRGGYFGWLWSTRLQLRPANPRILLDCIWYSVSTAEGCVWQWIDYSGDYVITTMNESLTNDANPYSAPTSVPAEQGLSKEQESRWKFAMMGAAWSVVSAFPIAGVMGLIFRFPVPFVGYVSGYEAILPAMLAVFFYGVLLGGLLLVGVLGAIAGAVSANLSGPLVQHQRRAVRITSLVITTVCLFLLAILDWIVGPW
jgi:hypothetical protein